MLSIQSSPEKTTLSLFSVKPLSFCQNCGFKGEAKQLINVKNKMKKLKQNTIFQNCLV